MQAEPFVDQFESAKAGTGLADRLGGIWPMLADEDDASAPHVHAFLASHNRRRLTVCAIERLRAQSKVANVQLDLVLFDDGSEDGTSEAVAERFPEVFVMRGDGTSFWALSMARAESQALKRCADSGSMPANVFLWLNDDVNLDHDALERLIGLYREHPDAVLAGAMRDPRSGAVTYSGLRRRGRHPLRFLRVEPCSSPIPVDTFNGNLVLVPEFVARELSGIDGRYSHGWADIDYGLRCQEFGIRVLLAPGTFGTCPRNPPIQESLRSAWVRFVGPKGAGNPRSLKRFLRRHGGAFWPVYFICTYLMWWVRRVTLVMGGD